MVKLIIRDDDCNFFTNPSDLEKVYSRISGFPISYAVIPTVTDVIGGCPDTKGNLTPRFVGDNIKLVNYLKDKLSKNECDIVMHGITHEYKYDVKGNKIPEMIWRDFEPNLVDQIDKWKRVLEQLFNYPINCFVAPSNKIGKDSIRAVYNNNMNFSGIISLSFNRDYSIKSLYNYVKRFSLRLITKFAYPGVLDYGTHKEINANNCINYDFLVSLYEYCEKNNYPLAINVHYWHMRDFPEKYEGFFKFIQYALNKGAIPTKLSDIF